MNSKYPQIRLLIVEDYPNMLKALVDLFCQEGYSVRQVMEGKHALEVAKSEKIDVVLCDNSLPDTSGLLLFKQMRKIEPQIDFFLMMDYGDVESKSEVKAKGIRDVFRKPIRIDELLSKVHQSSECIRSN